MRLHDFLVTKREDILREWETFARTCAPASITMEGTALRDHANEMVTVIAEFTEEVETAKEMFLAILGHDLRNPLGAIFTSATFMSETGEMDRTLTLQIAERAQRAARVG